MKKNSINTKAFGRHLKLIRIKRGITVQQLAAKSGMTQDNIWALESGAHEPSLDTMIKFSNILNISPDYLLSGELSPTLIAAKEAYPKLFNNFFRLSPSELDRVEDIMHILVKNRVNN